MVRHLNGPGEADTSSNPVRAARERKGVTREWLAFKAGLTVRTIERIEGGQVEPQRATRRVIAAALECDVTDLGWPEEAVA